jgi:hypothetical protein
MTVEDVSAFGTQVYLTASNTFPQGFPITQFADDADPVDSPSVKIGDAAMGVNGHLITWRKGVPLPATISVIPGSDDDTNLQILWDANRVGQGKQSARDIITVTIVYPNGNQVTLDTGIITDGAAAGSVGSAGRLKTKTYGFVFQNRDGGAS